LLIQCCFQKTCCETLNGTGAKIGVFVWCEILLKFVFFFGAYGQYKGFFLQHILKKNHQKKPGFLDLVFSDLELDPHVDGYQCGNTTRVGKKKTLARIYEVKYL
jgi:hypothetical protein